MRLQSVVFGSISAFGGGRTFAVAYLILKGMQLRIHLSDSEWSFSSNQMRVTRITTAQMVQIEIKWDLITKT